MTGKRRELSNSAKGMFVAFFVIYSDECSVEKGPAGQHIWFSAHLPRSGGKGCVCPVKHRLVKLIVWGCFWGKSSGAHLFPS